MSRSGGTETVTMVEGSSLGEEVGRQVQSSRPTGVPRDFVDRV